MSAGLRAGFSIVTTRKSLRGFGSMRTRSIALAFCPTKRSIGRTASGAPLSCLA